METVSFSGRVNSAIAYCYWNIMQIIKDANFYSSEVHASYIYLLNDR